MARTAAEIEQDRKALVSERKALDESNEAKKRQIEELGGSMASYSVFCYAIDNQGLVIDQTFEISYNIL